MKITTKLIKLMATITIALELASCAQSPSAPKIPEIPNLTPGQNELLNEPSGTPAEIEISVADEKAKAKAIWQENNNDPMEHIGQYFLYNDGTFKFAQTDQNGNFSFFHIKGVYSLNDNTLFLQVTHQLTRDFDGYIWYKLGDKPDDLSIEEYETKVNLSITLKNGVLVNRSQTSMTNKGNTTTHSSTRTVSSYLTESKYNGEVTESTLYTWDYSENAYMNGNNKAYVPTITIIK